MVRYYHWIVLIALTIAAVVVWLFSCNFVSVVGNKVFDVAKEVAFAWPISASLFWAFTATTFFVLWFVIRAKHAVLEKLLKETNRRLTGWGKGVWGKCSRYFHKSQQGQDVHGKESMVEEVTPEDDSAKSSNGKDKSKGSIAIDVLLMSCVGVGLLWLVLAFMEASNGLFGYADHGDTKIILPFLAPLISVPNVLYWWIRKDKHRVDEIAIRDGELLQRKREFDNLLQGQNEKQLTDLAKDLGEAKSSLPAIDSLANLARYSEVHRQRIIAILTFFVRKSSPLKIGLDTIEKEKVKPSPEVQAALTAIGQLGRKNDPPLDLSELDLRGANLSGHGLDGPDGHFKMVDFSRSRLDGAICANADFESAQFVSARLDNAKLNGAVLFRANLSSDGEFPDLGNASLSGANLQNANLREAILWWTNLNGADLWNADLEKATLWGADFTNTKTLFIKLNKARRDKKTKLTLNWGDKKAAVAVLRSTVFDGEGPDPLSDTLNGKA